MTAMRTIGAITLPGRRTAPRQARLFVRLVLENARLVLDEETAGDIELCVDELVANAWEHTASGRGGHITVKVAVDGATLRTTVIDDGDAESKPQVGTELTAEHGRGLRLVEGLAACWGVADAGEGTAVWAEFRHAGGPVTANGQHDVPDGELFSAGDGRGLSSTGGAALF